jgi:hypothetical protein
LELSLNGGEKFRWFRHDLKDGVGFWLGAPEYYREDECFVEAVLPVIFWKSRSMALNVVSFLA